MFFNRVKRQNDDKTAPFVTLSEYAKLLEAVLQLFLEGRLYELTAQEEQILQMQHPYEEAFKRSDDNPWSKNT